MPLCAHAAAVRACCRCSFHARACVSSPASGCLHCLLPGIPLPLHQAFYAAGTVGLLRRCGCATLRFRGIVLHRRRLFFRDRRHILPAHVPTTTRTPPHTPAYRAAFLDAALPPPPAPSTRGHSGARSTLDRRVCRWRFTGGLYYAPLRHCAPAPHTALWHLLHRAAELVLFVHYPTTSSMCSRASSAGDETSPHELWLTVLHTSGGLPSVCSAHARRFIT